MKQVEELFSRQQREGKFPGGQLVVMRDDEVLCDVSLGLAHGYRKEAEPVAVTASTRFQVMSAPMVTEASAICFGASLRWAAPFAWRHAAPRLARLISEGKKRE
ncbi:MAG TPA: hypothetical protein VFK05_17600 [Polyangiaceae bacterium]|nr:hypothetical protein [Polyangiaceae bacterium]